MSPIGSYAAAVQGGTSASGGIQVVTMAGDGNCLYYSIAGAIGDSDYDAAFIRAAIVRYQRANREQLRTYVEGNLNDYFAIVVIKYGEENQRSGLRHPYSAAGSTSGRRAWSCARTAWTRIRKSICDIRAPITTSRSALLRTSHATAVA